MAPFTPLGYRAGPMLLVIIAGLTLFRGTWKDGRRVRSAAVALAAIGGICFLLYCVVPPRLNGSYYFAERFPILAVLFLLATAAAVRPPGWWSAAAGGAGGCVTVAVLLLQGTNMARIAAQIAPAWDSPPAATASVGVIVGPAKSLPDGLSFDPYMWGAVHYFRRSRAILANEPWMDLPIIMMQPLTPDRWSYLDPEDASQVLVNSLVGGAAVPPVDFAVQEGPSDMEIEGLMRRMGWTQGGRSSEFLRIYRHRR